MWLAGKSHFVGHFHGEIIELRDGPSKSCFIITWSWTDVSLFLREHHGTLLKRKNIENLWETMVSAQLSFELHWSPQLRDLYETSGLRCLAPASSRQQFWWCFATIWVVASKVVNLLMFIDVYWGPTPQTGFAIGSILQFSTTKGGWDGLLWKRIEHINWTSVLARCQSSFDVVRSLGEGHMVLITARADSKLMDVTVVALTWNCEKNCAPFRQDFAFGPSLFGVHPPKLQVSWVTWSQRIGFGVPPTFLLCRGPHVRVQHCEPATGGR